MDAWLSLLKKELRLGLGAFIAPIVVFIVSIVAALYIGGRNGFGWEAVVFVSLFATGFQVFYLLYYLLNSFQTEKKMLHLWIHSPMPGYGLLSAKLVAALISMLITLLITGTTLFVAIQQSVTISQQLQIVKITDVSFFGGVHLILLALSFAAVFIFFWMVFLVINRNLGSFVSFLSTLVIFIVTTTVYSSFKETIIYEKLTMWGELQFSGITESISITTSLEEGTEVLTEVGQLSVYIGAYLFETVVALLLFWGACWLLDRKVEV
jgi:hypothetical protein